MREFKLKKSDINLVTCRFEMIQDFSRESQNLDFSRFYIYSNELHSDKALRLFIDTQDESTLVYKFESKDSYYLKYQFKDCIDDIEILLPNTIICKYCLVRVTEPGSDKNIESYLRIMLKDNFQDANYISLEDELYNKKITKWKYIK